MKKLLGSLWLVLWLFGGCTPRPYPSQLQTADSLTSACPDSARSLLTSLTDQMKEAPEATRMYYHLLCIKADDKAYISHTSDSLIQAVLHYYKENNDRQHLPEAYYYAGRVYRDLGDAPQALECFQQAAISIKEQKATDFRLKSMIYYQTGLIYLYQGIYDKSLEAFKLSKENTEWAKDSIFLVSNLREIGKTYSALHQADSTLYYYEAAKQLAIQLHNNTLTSIVNQEISDIYLQLGYIDKAKSTLMSSLSTLKNYPAPYYSTLAYYYNKIGKNDSATYCYKQMLYTGNHYHKRTAYKGLSEIARKQGNPSLALEYIDKSTIYADSIQQHINKEAIHKANALYNYQLREKENIQLEKEVVRLTQHKNIILFILIILILAAITYSLFHRFKRIIRQPQHRELKHIQDAQYQQSDKFIRENTESVPALNQEAIQASDPVQQASLQAQKERLLCQNKHINAERNEQISAEAALHQSEIYAKFHHAILESYPKLNLTDWEILREEIDNRYKGFTARLLALYPFSKMELNICLLLKIGINVTGIALLTNRSKSSIVSARKSMYRKVFQKDGKPDQWDTFIRSL